MMKLVSSKPTSSFTIPSNFLIVLRPGLQLVQLNLHRTENIITKFSTFITNKIFYAQTKSLLISSHFELSEPDF